MKYSSIILTFMVVVMAISVSPIRAEEGDAEPEAQPVQRIQIEVNGVPDQIEIIEENPAAPAASESAEESAAPDAADESETAETEADEAEAEAEAPYLTEGRAAIGEGLNPLLVKRTNLFAEAIEYAQPRTVKIFGGGIGREQGYASGIIISEDGMILCAHGIYASSPRLRVVTADGKSHTASIVRRSDALQLLLLKIETPTPNYFELDRKIRPQVGDWVIAVSNAFAVAQFEEELSVNMGIVSLRSELDVKRRSAEMTYEAEALLIDAITSNPGSPGGALMSVNGKIVGMLGKNLQSRATNTWINYAVPVDLLHDFVEGKVIEVARRDENAKPYLGLRIFAVSRTAPAYVDRIRSDSPADEAGFRRDDMILSIDDTTITDVSDYNKAFEAMRPGQRLRFVVKRGQRIVTITVTPTAEEEEDD